MGHSKAKSKNNDCGTGNHCNTMIRLQHDDGNRLQIPIWVLIVAVNVGLWWWHPLLLVLIGAVIAVWVLGYRLEQEKDKNDFT